MRVAKPVNLQDKNILKSDKFMNKSRILDKKYALLDKNDIMLAGTPYPAMDKDGGEVIPREVNLLKNADLEGGASEAKGVDTNLEFFLSYIDNTPFGNDDVTWATGRGLSADLSWEGKVLRMASKEGIPVFPFPEIPEFISNGSTGYKIYGNNYKIQKRINFLFNRNVTKTQIGNNKLRLEFLAAVPKDPIYFTDFNLGKYENGEYEEKFKLDYTLDKNIDYLTPINKTTLQRFVFDIDVSSLKAEDELNYVTIAFSTIYSHNYPIRPGLIFGDPSLRVYKNESPIASNEVLVDSLEGITFEDVDFSVYGKKVGALMLRGTVNSEQLPVEITEECRKKLKNINFL